MKNDGMSEYIEVDYDLTRRPGANGYISPGLLEI